MKAGDKLEMPQSIKGGGEVLVMAVAEGHMMVRRKGAVPFTHNIKDFENAKAREASHE